MRFTAFLRKSCLLCKRMPLHTKQGLQTRLSLMKQSRTMMTDTLDQVQKNQAVDLIAAATSDGDSSLAKSIVEAGSAAVLSTTGDSIEHFGLNTYTTAGLVRIALQLLHQQAGLPWADVIIVGVIAGRLILLPFTIKNVRHMDKMQIHQRSLSELTSSVMEAKKSGDYNKEHVSIMALSEYMTRNNINLAMPFMYMIPQSVFFMSYFFGIRKMAEAPIESFKTEGLLWFSDLTCIDPVAGLSIICAALIVATLKVGAAVEVSMPPSGIGSMDPKAMQKFMMVCMPVVILAAGRYLPAGVLLYWCTSNAISLLIALMLKTPAIRKMLKLPLKT